MIVSYHEAAHALAHLELGLPFTYVTNCQDGAGADGFVLNDPPWPNSVTFEAWCVEEPEPAQVFAEHAAIISFAGDHAVKRLRGRRDLVGAEQDRKDAWDYASKVFRDARMTKGFLRDAWVASELLVARVWPEIEAVAGRLLKDGRLTQAQVWAVVRAQRQVALQVGKPG